MKHRISAAAALVTAVLSIGCVQLRGTPASPVRPPSQSQSYAGLEQRAVKAIPPDKIEDLLAGRGAGYALAAELNHYPGPRHVLELAPELQLGPEQEHATRSIFASMEREAQELGAQLVSAELELDQLFASGGAGSTQLAQLTHRIAGVEGRLRAVHLAAHLKVKEVLSPEQVAHYDRLRGYTSPSAPGPAHGAGAEGGQHDGPRKH